MSTLFPHPISTLPDLLRLRTERSPDKTGYTFLGDGEQETGSLTFVELDRQARAIAARLQQIARPQERALLVYPSGLEFLGALFGCFYSGLVAVPVPPPDAKRLDRTLPRLEAVAADAKPTVVLTTAAIATAFAEFGQRSPALEATRWIISDGIEESLGERFRSPRHQRDWLAVLQYTSGSTAAPKGVMVSHGNVLANSRYLQQAWGFSPQGVSLTWVPNFHDDGLINGVVQPVFSGNRCIMLPPVAVVQRPIRWLRAISRYRVNQTGGPNFIYALCNRKTTAEQRQGLDLSSWSMAYNAAEPIRDSTLHRFFELFEAHGFSWRTFFPTYGLAETTLIVSTRRPQEDPVLLTVDKRALENNTVAAVPTAAAAGQTLVGCGHPILDTRIEIVDPETGQRCQKERIGEVWVASASVTLGYWRQPEKTAETYVAPPPGAGAGRFLRTGDLGFLRSGELFITGRVKDLIIIRGRNLYPHDIESNVESSHPAIRAGCCAAFSVEAGGEERLVIAAEIGHRVQGAGELDVPEVIRAIRRAVSEGHELQVAAVVLLDPRSLPKTSSGKLRRGAARATFLAGGLRGIGGWSSEEMAPASGPPAIGGKGADRGAEGGTEGGLEIADLIGWIREYAEHRLNSRLIDERRSIPPSVVLDFGNRGLFGLQVPRSYGGLDLGYRDTLRVLEQLAAVDLTLATFVTGSNFLGIRPIARYATESLREELLPQLASGRQLAAFAMTEPEAGSAVRRIAAEAIPDGRGGWRLRGTKTWIGSASWASVLNVFVRLVDPASEGPGEMTGFVVRREARGLRLGPEALTMGLRGMAQSVVHLEDVAVGPADLLGAPGGGGEAAEDAMLITRLGLAAMSVGAMKRCGQLMHRYAARRTIATGRLLDNPLTLVRLSDLTAAIAALESLVALVAELLDAGQIVPEEAFLIAKISGPELLWRAADTLVQLLGGRGYIETNEASRILRDSRVFRIFEGPTEALRMHLGSRLIHRGEEFHRFLSKDLEVPAISRQLRRATEEIRDRAAQQPGPFADRTAALRWGYHLAGELATGALLLATVEHGARRGDPARWRPAAEWAQRAFERQQEEARSTHPAEGLLLDASGVGRAIAGYAATIGDVEQGLAGEEHEKDPLLRRDGDPPRPEVPSEDHRVPVPAPAAPPPSVLRGSGPGSEVIAGWVASWLTDELGLAAGSIEPGRPLAELGIDSVLAVDLAQVLGDRLGRPLEATLLWRFSTIESLARHLGGEDAEPPPVAPRPRPDVAVPPADPEGLPEAELARLLAAEVTAVRGRKQVL